MDGSRRVQAQVVRPHTASERLLIGRLPPPDDLAWCVDYCWWVEWDTPAPYAQEVLPRPVVHVAGERWEGEDRLVVTGVPTRRFDRELEGRGRAVALAFRPGGFRPFIRCRASDIVDASVPAARLLGAPDHDIASRILDPDVSLDQAGRDLLDWFAEIAPARDPLVAELAQLVETTERDRTIRRAEQLAALAGVSLRTLQRWFREYVGPGPKWVVQRYRLLDVLEAANAHEPIDWAWVAADLGYADQSHLIRHFRAVIGEPPARYAEQPDLRTTAPPDR